jgi:hypothetical protein
MIEEQIKVAVLIFQGDALLSCDKRRPAAELFECSSSVDEELLLRNEYLTMENRILRNQIKGRIRLPPHRQPMDMSEFLTLLPNLAGRGLGWITRTHIILFTAD